MDITDSLKWEQQYKIKVVFISSWKSIYHHLPPLILLFLQLFHCHYLFCLFLMPPSPATTTLLQLPPPILLFHLLLPPPPPPPCFSFHPATTTTL
ncbi:hypothetical protein Pcinc_026692, partial [Petrolisthes cinctipes]